jgi:hypothetical protein
MNTGHVLRRLMQEKGDKLDYIASMVGICRSAVSAVATGQRDVPDRWLARLTPEYALPLIIAKIDQHHGRIAALAALAGRIREAKEKPQAGGPPGAAPSRERAAALGTAAESANHNSAELSR